MINSNRWNGIRIGAHAAYMLRCIVRVDVQMGARVPTWQVTAQHLHPHANPGRRPPLRKDPDVLRHDLIKPPHLWRVVVAVSFENLRADVTRGELKPCGIFCVIQRGMKNLHRGSVCLFFFFSFLLLIDLSSYYLGILRVESSGRTFLS